MKLAEPQNNQGSKETKELKETQDKSNQQNQDRKDSQDQSNNQEKLNKPVKPDGAGKQDAVVKPEATGIMQALAPLPTNNNSSIRNFANIAKGYIARKIETGKKIGRGIGKTVQVALCFGVELGKAILPPIGKQVLDLSNGFLSLLTAFPKFFRASRNYPRLRQIHFLWLANMLRYCTYGFLVVAGQTLLIRIPALLFNSNAQGSMNEKNPEKEEESMPIVIVKMSILMAGNPVFVYFAYRAIVNFKLLNLSNTHEAQKITLKANKELAQFSRNNLDITDLNSMFRDLRAQAFSGFEGLFISFCIACIRVPYFGPYADILDRAITVSLEIYALGTELDAYPLHISGIAKPDVHNIQTHRKLISFGKGLTLRTIREWGMFPLLNWLTPAFLAKGLACIDMNWIGPAWYRDAVISNSLYSLFKLNYTSLQNIKLEKSHLKERNAIDLFAYSRDLTEKSLSRGLTSGLPLLGRAIVMSRRFFQLLPIIGRFIDQANEEPKERNELAPIEDAVNLLKSFASNIDWTDPASRMFFNIYSKDFIKMLNFFKAFRSRGVLKLLQFTQFFVPKFMGGQHIGVLLKYLMERVPDEEIDKLIRYIEKQAKFGEQNQHMSLKSWLLSLEGWKERFFEDPEEEPEDYEFVAGDAEFKEEFESSSLARIDSMKTDAQIAAEISKIYGCVGDYGFLEHGEAFKQIYDFFYEKISGKERQWKEEAMTAQEIDDARKEVPSDPRESLDPYQAESLAKKFDRNSRELLHRLQTARSAFEQFSRKVTSVTPGNVVRGAVNVAETAQDQLDQITGAGTALNVAGAAATLLPGGGLVAGSIGLFNLATRNAAMLKFFAAWLDDKKVAEKKEIAEYLGNKKDAPDSAEKLLLSSPLAGLASPGSDKSKTSNGQSQKPVIKFTIEKPVDAGKVDGSSKQGKPKTLSDLSGDDAARVSITSPLDDATGSRMTSPMDVAAGLSITSPMKALETMEKKQGEENTQNGSSVENQVENQEGLGIRLRKTQEAIKVDSTRADSTSVVNLELKSQAETQAESKEAESKEAANKAALEQAPINNAANDPSYTQTILLKFDSIKATIGNNVPQWVTDLTTGLGSKLWGNPP